jgi:hypothetical protein
VQRGVGSPAPTTSGGGTNNARKAQAHMNSPGKAYQIKWDAHGPGYAPNWITVPVIYTNRKSATQRARRIRQNGIANPFSGHGKLRPRAVLINELALRAKAPKRS